MKLLRKLRAIKKNWKGFRRVYEAEFTKWLLGPHAIAVLVKADNGLYAVAPDDLGVGRRLRSRGSYGAKELLRLERHMPENCRALIVGSHVGTLVVPLSRLSLATVAIEANPNTFALLKTNLALNGIANCETFNVAASDKEGTMEFLLSRVNSGGSKMAPKKDRYIYRFDKPERILVKSSPLDALIENKDFDLVVMDIEGSECLALAGMQGILAKTKTLAVEFIPHLIKDVAGATAKEFLSALEPHFARVLIPSKGLEASFPEAALELQRMFDANEGDDAIVFMK